MCNAGHDTRYSKAGEFGADALYDPNCHGPRPSIGLSLYFRSRKDLNLMEYGGGWTAFWWWTPGATWPTNEHDVLQYPYGSCTKYDYYCFQRLPLWAKENFTELLAIDSRGTVYRWEFDSSNPTAHAVWLAFHDHMTTPYQKVRNLKAWNPKALVGKPPERDQDSFMYGEVKGLKSLLLDDDNGDHYTSLSIGYGMSGPHPFGGLGVDYLYDTTGSPDVKKGLTLYFRVQRDQLVRDYGSGWRPFWWFPAGIDWPSCKSSKVVDVLQDPYGTCKNSDVYCFQRLPVWAYEDKTELLALDTQDTVYKWTFDSSNPTAHAAWRAFHGHTETPSGAVKDSSVWNPDLLRGKSPTVDQDSFMYRAQGKAKSLLLDDDNCDCLSSLNIGGSMCGSRMGRGNDYGEDHLYDPTCGVPKETNGLWLYFRAMKDMSFTAFGFKWTAFWWWTKDATWPTKEKDVLGYVYGHCKEDDVYCFQRLPTWAVEDFTHLLAIDTEGNMYTWQFSSSNPTAHAVWQAFHSHQETPAGKIKNNIPWNPKVIKGTKPKQNQDSFMYRTEHGIKSVILDDDNCDCLTTLSMGHGQCGTTFSTSYGPENRFGVDALYDHHCNTPRPSVGLTLYFSTSRPISLCTHGGNWLAFWWWSPNAKWPKPSIEDDVIGHEYGTCGPRDLHCFGRLPSWAKEDSTEILAVDSAGNEYKWKFDSSNPTAHAAWQAFHDHEITLAGKIRNNKPWNPVVLKGKSPKFPQDSFMYRKQNGVKSILLDDDNCDCQTTLNIGHGMCADSHDKRYGPANQYGVDTLYDPGCQVPRPSAGLTLYFRTY